MTLKEYISNFDPIREVRIKNGKFRGWHKIYCSEKVFRKDGHKEPVVKQWWEGNSGDWVRADDGFILQILDKYPLYRKNHKSQTSDKPANFFAYIFCNRMTRIYIRKDGSINASRFLGSVISLNRNHFSDDYNPLGKHMSERKRQFIMQLAANVAPTIAYMNVYKINYNLAKTRAYGLIMKDKDVMEELTRQLKPSIIDDLEKAGITGSYLMNELKKTIDDNKVSSQVRGTILAFLTRIKYNLDTKGLPAADPKNLSGIANATIMNDRPEELRTRLLERSNEEGED